MVTSFAADASRGPGAINGRIAASDHRHLLADFYFFTKVDAPEETYPFHHTRKVLPLDTKAHAAMGAYGNEDCLVAISDLGERDISAYLYPGLYLHAQLLYVAYLLPEDLFGKTVFGNAVPQHASRFRQGLEDRDRITEPGQMIGSAQAGGA